MVIFVDDFLLTSNSLSSLWHINEGLSTAFPTPNVAYHNVKNIRLPHLSSNYVSYKHKDHVTDGMLRKVSLHCTVTNIV